MSNLHKDYYFDRKGKVYIIGDLHGKYKEFISFLDKIDFDFENDLIVSVGDLVDRGEDSLSCFNLLYKSWFIAVRGNHEDFCTHGNYSLETKNIHILNGGDWFYNLPSDVRKSITHKIDSIPLCITLHIRGKKYGIIHADILHDDWECFVNDISKEDDMTINRTLWGRGRITKIKNNVSVNENIKNIEHIYFGHTVCKDKITYGNTTYLDTGLVFGGKLSYVVL